MSVVFDATRFCNNRLFEQILEFLASSLPPQEVFFKDCPGFGTMLGAMGSIAANNLCTLKGFILQILTRIPESRPRGTILGAVGVPGNLGG